MAHHITRRTFTIGGGTLAAGGFALPLRQAVALQASPAAGPATLGYVSTRLRSVATAADHDLYVEMVREHFAPQVSGMDGLRAYLVANLLDDPTAHVSITVLDEQSRFAAFREKASAFIDLVEDTIAAPVGTEEWEGDLRLASGPSGAADTSATPAPADGGYLTVRIHTSAPGSDPLDLVEIGSEEFIPLVSGLPGFRGYLWYTIPTGFVAISLFDTAEEADASTEAAHAWMGATMADATVGEPRVINATVVYADTPIFDAR